MSYEIVDMTEVYSYYPTDTLGTFRVFVCDRCGMPVAASYTGTHDEWHEKLDELSDKVWRAGLE